MKTEAAKAEAAKADVVKTDTTKKSNAKRGVEDVDGNRMSAARRHLMSWGTGRALPGRPEGRHAGAATVVLENPRHLAEVLGSDLVGPHTVVLAPGRVPETSDVPGPLVVGYQGSLSEPGGDLSIDDSFFLQTQDYATSAYMSVIGATLIRVTEEADFETFLADADRARAEGDFAAFVTDPAVQLADVSALGAGPDGDGPSTRLYVGQEGELSTSPGGSRLGRLGSSFASVVAAWDRANTASAHPCAVALGDTVPEDVRVAALTERPWLGRYLAALAAVRELRARGLDGVRVSGFGGRLASTPAAPAGAADTDDSALPLLLWTDEAAYVHAPAVGRTFRVGREAGALVETLLVCGSLEAAAGHADRDRLCEVEAFFADAGVPLRSTGLLGAGA
ncbi:daptide biosynthesis RiPP recognition protein [Streptomyces sp. SID5910]|uniref:daptide biosynthesis RiPP recognition protein n=1 Tax=Streptomyces sp. SID5910 TaxID=2690312 RepID=UPI00192747C6|nr:daptide biosynthesis RiPP recognition protein [Streptomyces sp. SID5910]